MTVGYLLPPPESSVFYGHRHGILKHQRSTGNYTVSICNSPRQSDGTHALCT